MVRIVRADSPLIAPEHGRATRLGDLERLARQVGFVHHAVAVDHDAVHRADIVRVDHEGVSDGHVLQPTSTISALCFRWATDGIRLASAASTEEALRNA